MIIFYFSGLWLKKGKPMSANSAWSLVAKGFKKNAEINSNTRTTTTATGTTTNIFQIREVRLWYDNQCNRTNSHKIVTGGHFKDGKNINDDLVLP